MALIIDQEGIMQLVGFQIGSKLFGADILTVREILRDPAIEPVDNLPEYIEGIIRLRGEVLPILDMGKFLSVPTSTARDRVWALVGKAGQRNVGYIVDAVTPIVRVKTDAIFPAPDIIMERLRSKYINGVCQTDKGLLVVIDLDRILLEDEVRTLNKLDIS